MGDPCLCHFGAASWRYVRLAEPSVSMTPPPTETPAPLSDRLREACSPLRPLLDEAAAQITSLTEQVAALTAERDGAHKDGYREGYEAGCAKDVAEVESRLARHVAALQEIGRGVEEDQATIARLREELAQADAVCAWTVGNIGAFKNYAEMRKAGELATARHRARHDTEGREG